MSYIEHLKVPKHLNSMSEGSKDTLSTLFVKGFFFLVMVIALGQTLAAFFAFLKRNAFIIIAVLVVVGLVVYRWFFYTRKPPVSGGDGSASDYF